MDSNFRFNLTSFAFKVFHCFVFIGILSFAAQVIWAQEEQKKIDPEMIKIGEEYYTRGQIIADFLNVAFSEGVWNEEGHWKPDMFSKIIDQYGPQNLDLQDEETRKEYEEKKLSVPWLADYMYRPDGWPQHNVLHRWEREITISVGWPRFIIHGPKTALITSVYDEEGTAALYPSIIGHIKEQLPAIERSTGLPVRFISPDDPTDATAEYARIRVIPKKDWHLRAAGSMSSGYVWYPHESEELLWGGVLFETSRLKEMDAYLLPQTNDEPGLVICKIDTDLPDAFFKALITECLVRGLGLPGRGGRSEMAVVGPWRENVGLDSEHPKNPPPLSVKNLPQAMTPYDAWMIGLLYCPSIKSGMDKNAALQALTRKNDKCVSQHLYP